MNTANVHAGRLERRVRRVGSETMSGVFGCCSLPWFTADCRLRSESALRVTNYPFGAVRGKPLIVPYGPIQNNKIVSIPSLLALEADFDFCPIHKFDTSNRLLPLVPYVIAHTA